MIVPDMSPKADRAIFITGMLVAIPLAATVTVLLLRRAFPDSLWPTLVGPAVSAGAALWLARALNRKP